MRRAFNIVAEIIVIAFFVLLGAIGAWILPVLHTDALVSLPSMPISVVQSVIPISAVLIIVAELTYLVDLSTRRTAPARPARRPPSSAMVAAVAAHDHDARPVRLRAGARVINVPIAVSLGVVAVVAMVASHGTGSLPNVALVTYSGATNFPAARNPALHPRRAIMNASGISRRLIAVAIALFGWIRGGLAHVSIGASMFSRRSPDRPSPTSPRWARS